MFELLVFDPGESTGVVHLSYTEDTFPVVENVWQIPGGVGGFLQSGFLEWVDTPGLLFNFAPLEGAITTVSERFTPRPMARTYKSDELTPLRIEGVLMALNLMPQDYNLPNWQTPQYLVLDNRPDTPEKRKIASDNVLRELGLWHTGKQVGQKDANDVNSAMKHAVSFLRKAKHVPTLDALTDILVTGR